MSTNIDTEVTRQSVKWYAGAQAKSLFRRTYERLNHCVFSDEEWKRIMSEAPADGIPIATRNGFELALYEMPNGSKFATLKDGTDETWEAYCAHLATEYANR